MRPGLSDSGAPTIPVVSLGMRKNVEPLPVGCGGPASRRLRRWTVDPPATGKL